MLIPKFWAKATQQVQLESKTFYMHCWRHSQVSVSDALKNAEVALKQKIASLIKGDRVNADYSESPIREEILKEYRGPDQQVIGVITRSSMGFRVLNTLELAFVDIDFTASQKPGWLMSLFRKKESLADRRAEWERSTIENLGQVFDEQGIGGRLYRTANGLRAMITSRKFRGETAETESLLSRCESDALYRRLCRNQKCFRARLSPKPRRLGISAPRLAFPRLHTDEIQKAQFWIDDYENKQSQFGTCDFIQSVGNVGATMMDFREIIDEHDRWTRALERVDLK